MTQPYNRRFFADQRDESRESARAMVPILADLVEPASVADVGCGVGTWTSVFAERGLAVTGFDGDYVDRGALLIPPDRFRAVDLTQPVPDLEPVDLAISLEVGEHLPESAAPQLVATLTGLAPVVAFGAAIPWQGGTSHINEQWQTWWAALFAQRGYVAVDALRDKVWDDQRIAPWYVQNTVLYVREGELANYPKLAGHRVGPPHDVVHPRLYTLQHESSGFSAWMRDLPDAARRTAGRGVRKVQARMRG
jgi:SAM-dependent methyltransferase